MWKGSTEVGVGVAQEGSKVVFYSLFSFVNLDNLGLSRFFSIWMIFAYFDYFNLILNTVVHSFQQTISGSRICFGSSAKLLVTAQFEDYALFWTI